MAASVTSRAVGTATIVRVDGVIDADLLVQIIGTLARDEVPGVCVLDLSDVVLTNPASVRGLIAHLDEWGERQNLRIVCSRITARRMFRRWGGASLPLYSSAAAALRIASQSPTRPRATGEVQGRLSAAVSWDTPFVRLPDHILLTPAEAGQLLEVLDLAATARTDEERVVVGQAVRVITAKLWPELGDPLDGDDEACLGAMTTKLMDDGVRSPEAAQRPSGSG